MDEAASAKKSKLEVALGGAAVEALGTGPSLKRRRGKELFAIQPRHANRQKAHVRFMREDWSCGSVGVSAVGACTGYTIAGYVRRYQAEVGVRPASMMVQTTVPVKSGRRKYPVSVLDSRHHQPHARYWARAACEGGWQLGKTSAIIEAECAG